MNNVKSFTVSGETKNFWVSENGKVKIIQSLIGDSEYSISTIEDMIDSEGDVSGQDWFLREWVEGSIEQAIKLVKQDSYLAARAGYIPMSEHAAKITAASIIDLD